MADMLWKVFEISVSIFECCVVIHFICAFLQHDFKTLKGKLIFIAGVVMDLICVTLINNYTNYEGVLGAAYILVYFLYAVIFLKSDLPKKLFAAVLANSVLMCTVSMVSSIITNVFKRSLSEIYGENSIYRIISIAVNLLLLVSVFNLILKYKVTTVKKNEWRLIFSVLGISFVSLAFIHIVLIKSDVDELYAEMLMLSEFGIIFMNIVCFYMTYSLSKSNSETERLRMLRQQEEYRQSYAENIKEQYEEIRRMRHDMKQNLAVISALYCEQKYDEANEFAGRVSEKLEKLEMVIDVHNDFINAILNSKLSIASEYGIRVICASASNIDGIDDIDLCNLLGNILDNAIEAAKQCENGYIEVSIRSDESTVLVIIANSIAKSVLSTNKELRSTKDNSSRHGYGVKTICSIAEKYSGKASFNEEGNMFYCQAMMYKQHN